MARPLRVEYKGAFYHVTSRGNQKLPIFFDDRGRLRFLDFLAEAHDAHGGRFHAYCLMENHFHLMIETPRGNLSQIMHFINAAYSSYINKSRSRVGHLFQGRFKSLLIEADGYAQRLARYIHMNPVRAKLAQRPDHYRWSSCRDYSGLRKSPSWLATEYVLGLFGPDKNKARQRFLEYCLNERDQDAESLRGEFKGSVVLGSADFVERMTSAFNPAARLDRELPELRTLVIKPPLPRVQSEADRVLGRNNRFNRDASIWYASKRAGYRLAEIAAFFSLSQSGTSNAVRRMKKHLARSEVLRQAVHDMENGIKGDNEPL